MNTDPCGFGSTSLILWIHHILQAGSGDASPAEAPAGQQPTPGADAPAHPPPTHRGAGQTAGLQNSLPIPGRGNGCARKGEIFCLRKAWSTVKYFFAHHWAHLIVWLFFIKYIFHVDHPIAREIKCICFSDAIVALVPWIRICFLVFPDQGF